MNDESLMPFGEHKGKKLIDVPASYLLYLYDQNKCYGELKEYIEDNLDVLNEEKKRQQTDFINQQKEYYG